MILSTFSIFIFLAFIFVLLGYFINADAFKIIGYTILFIISLVFLTNNLELYSHTDITTNGTVQTVTPVYTTYANHTIAFLMTISAIIGVVFTQVERKTRQEEQDE
jgi:hypothetical protein